jgi:hypothetical protein
MQLRRACRAIRLSAVMRACYQRAAQPHPETVVKQLLLAVMLAAALVSPALAERFRIPADDPVVTIEAPEDWTVTQIDKGIELSSDDDEVYLAIEGTPMKGLVDLTADAVTFLNRAGVTVDKSTEKSSEGTVNGFKMNDIGWAGRDKDGDVLIHLMILTITPTKGVLFTYWASPQGDKEHDETIRKIIRSIRKIGG